jgi:hypothetical protein
MSRFRNPIAHCERKRNPKGANSRGEPDQHIHKVGHVDAIGKTDEPLFAIKVTSRITLRRPAD